MARILLLIDSLGAGGAQRQIAGLAILLHEKGHLVKVVYYHPDFFYREYLDEHDVENEYVGEAKNNVKRFFLIVNAIRKYNPETVISFLDKPNMMACLLKSIGMKFRLIAGERNTTQYLNRSEKLKFKFLKKADVIVPNSISQERFIITHYPSLRDKVQTITNFVDLDVFYPRQNKKKNSILNIIGVGRLEAQKNIGCLIKATKLVIDLGYNICVDWYGRKTSLIRKYEMMMEKLEIENVFSFHEPTQVIHNRYQEADLFCLPSIFEGFPNVLCEAMACGLPTICSDVCDNAFIMEDGVNGYLFNPQEPQDLAGRIIQYITIPEEEKILMGKKSRELAEQKFGEDAFVDKYLKLIQPQYG